MNIEEYVQTVYHPMGHPEVDAFWLARDCPSLVKLKLRKRGEELLPWYLRGLSDDHLIRSEAQGPVTCASCGGGTWMELYGEPACHECVDRLRFAGYPLGFREAVKKGNYAWPTF